MGLYIGFAFFQFLLKIGFFFGGVRCGVELVKPPTTLRRKIDAYLGGSWEAGGYGREEWRVLTPRSHFYGSPPPNFS